MDDLLKQATPDMLSGFSREIAEAIGIEAALRLFEKFGGEAVYLPKAESIRLRMRDGCIRQEFDKGENTRELAKRYGITTRLVQRIVAEAYQPPKTKG